MHRTMEHVMSYFNAELGVACSLDPEGKLTFKVSTLVPFPSTPNPTPQTLTATR